MQVLFDRISVYLEVGDLFRIIEVRTVMILRTGITITIYLAKKKGLQSSNMLKSCLVRQGL